MYIILLTILGILLRLVNIDKPEGLWNDEYVSWFVASTSFKGGFWSEVLKQCHMPLYYLYLKPFAGCSDIILRLTSLLPSILAIIVMYFVGREFSKKTGYICATITALLPFLVYYSQEVRFYSLLFLFSTLSLLFLIKLSKGENAWLGYSISSLLILFTHVLGGIYVFMTVLYLLYMKNKFSKKIIFSGILVLFLIIPMGIHISKMLPSSQWWGVFSYTNILFLFSDFFSPILTNNINAPQTFFYSKNLMFIILISAPTLLALFGILRGIKWEKGLALIALGNVLVLVCLALSDKIVFITKYTIEILPILILLFSLGITGKVARILISLYATFLFLSVFTPFYPTKEFRSEGHKLVGDVLNKVGCDKVLFTYYEPNRFYRYLDFSPQTLHISKNNRFEYLEKPSKILAEIDVGERVAVVFLDSVSFIPENWIQTAKEKDFPEMFVTFSVIRQALIKELNDNYTDFNLQKNGSWTIISATKLR